MGPVYILKVEMFQDVSSLWPFQGNIQRSSEIYSFPDSRYKPLTSNELRTFLTRLSHWHVVLFFSERYDDHEAACNCREGFQTRIVQKMEIETFHTPSSSPTNTWESMKHAWGVIFAPRSSSSHRSLVVFRCRFVLFLPIPRDGHLLVCPRWALWWLEGFSRKTKGISKHSHQIV